MNKRYQPNGNRTTLSVKLDALAAQIHALAPDTRNQDGSGMLTNAVAQARHAIQALQQTASATRQAMQALAKPLANTGAPSRALSACPGGVCPTSGAQTAGQIPTGSAAGNSGGLIGYSSALSSGLGAALKSALSGDFQRALQSLLSSLARSIAGSLSRAVGGGLGGGLIGSLVGTGLSLLIGKLFHKRQSVQVENTVKSEVLNFPSLLGLDFATNPASRLFGERAVARGPAFTVEVSYKGGAEDLITAKVASRLADMNFQHGIAG